MIYLLQNVFIGDTATSNMKKHIFHDGYVRIMLHKIETMTTLSNNSWPT